MKAKVTPCLFDKQEVTTNLMHKLGLSLAYMPTSVFIRRLVFMLIILFLIT